MEPYDWDTDPWNWLEQRSEYSCLRLDYSTLDQARVYQERQRPVLRLVKIEPGFAQDPLRCTLTIPNSVSLSANSPNEERENSYEAISYVWGSTDDVVPIRCRTDETELEYSYSWIDITKNCAEVFRRLRLLNKPRYVWIDAISIDQADPVDRAHYVRRMHHIYRDADRVVIVLPNYKKASGEYWAETELGAWIFTHPYFTRIWILQEVFWGRNPVVYAGSHELQWSELCEFHHSGLSEFVSLSAETTTSVEFVLAMGQSTKSTSASNKRSSLLKLYEKSKSFEATDPRDRLIALISMATDVTPPMEAILVDYTVQYDVLLERFAAVICFRSLDIMPGIERGISNSQKQIGRHAAMERCTNKIQTLMALPEWGTSNLIKTLTSHSAERCVWDVHGNDPSFRRSIMNVLREKVSVRHPWSSTKAISLCVCTVVFLVSLGVARLSGTRQYSGSQSKKMTVSKLMSVIEKSRATVYSAHSEYQARGLMRNLEQRKIEDKMTVRVVILGHEHFDLCLVPGNVNALQRRCYRALVDFSQTAGETPEAPIPLLLLIKSGRQRVLGRFYDLEPPPKEFISNCCHVPQVKHAAWKQIISVLNYDELKDIVSGWFDALL
ncbi:heterokaryon incompatibility protein-domain-containing protein [Lophiotrema nucula]|uniref:Heterokaryon incompatibility protein-domain-containing protein n=1 Tax=Lophiotrema nucula TaxID=690887 RepID=A0A6A5Z5Y4_9PLEO|nr:heterokaryon incompatibility protein-domain-containing protein [Lophiotrema nucula]